MNAITSMKKEINRIQSRQAEFVDDYGMIIPGRRDEYRSLIKEARDFRESIEWLNDNTGVER